MILVSLRDLQFRRRRFVVAIAGTSVVLALTLVLAGVSSSFVNEARRTTKAFHAGAWIVPLGSSGPFMSSATLPAAMVADVSARTGAPAAALAVLRSSVAVGGSTEEINVLGVEPGSFVDPPVHEGRAPAKPGEVTADDLLGAHVGDVLSISGREVTVVGRTHGLSYRANVPSVYVPLAEAQEMGYGGAPLATTIVSEREVTAPDGFVALHDPEVQTDLLGPLESPRQTILMVLGILWVVAVMIVGSVVYLSALDRVRDFAVFKAMGAPDRSVLSGLLAQSLLLSGVAYAIGSALSRVLAPLLPMQAEISGLTYVGLAGIAIAVAVLSSLAAVRRALSVDPALAFGGA